jgi:hypothetical protein
MNFFSFLVSAFRAGAFIDKGTWTTSEIATGTVHIAAMEYDPKSVQRVILKIALGLLYLSARDSAAIQSVFPQDPSSTLEERVAKAAIAINHICWPETIATWPDRHVAMIDVLEGRLRAVVSLYGDCHTVDLGPTESPQDFKRIVAFCRRDGAHTFLVGDAEADRVVQLLDQHLAERDGSQAA